MDWFRWHHGSTTDPKFQVVARRAGATVAEVLAVWACLLEAASANADERGNIGNFDHEAIDCLLMLPEGRTLAICAALDDKNLLDEKTGRVPRWERRQPKRERDDNSTERSRAFRERQRQQNAGNTTSEDATPSNAKQRAGTPRGEERREEETELSSSLRSDSSSAGADDGQQQGEETPKPDKAERLAQVTKEAIAAFNAKLGKPKGNLPSVRLVTKERMTQVKRCTQVAALIAKDRYGDSRLTPQFWEDYFEVVSKDPFWSGRQLPGEGHENWVPDFENLTHPKHMAKLFERAVADEPMAGAA